MSATTPPIVRLLRDELRRHPYRTLAIAFGVGCVLATRRGASWLLPLVARTATGMTLAALAPRVANVEEERRAP